MITLTHLEARASRPMPAAPGASPALAPSRPDAGFPPSDRRPGLPPDQGPQNWCPAASTSRVPLRRKRPAGTQGGGDIDEPSAVTERARSIGDRALSEIDAPGPHLTPACGGRLRRPRTEEWPLPDDPRSRRQLGALDPRSPITEEGSAPTSKGYAATSASRAKPRSSTPRANSLTARVIAATADYLRERQRRAQSLEILQGLQERGIEITG
jgi:hypothetical protein